MDDTDALRAAGRRWSRAVGARRRWERALPVDPGLSRALLMPAVGVS